LDEEKTMTVKEVLVPDIGAFSNVDVIEVLVKPGDIIEAETAMLTLETDKATMEIPAPFGGKVQTINVSPGDKVSKGSVILTLEAVEAESVPKAAEKPVAPKAAEPVVEKITEVPKAITPVRESVPVQALEAGAEVHAGPGVRRFARELGVVLTRVQGSGLKNRIMKVDIQAYVKSQLAANQSGSGGGAGLNLAPMPQVDFSQFGEIELKPLSRIKKLSGNYLHRNWVMVPHITQFDEADITEMEQFRKDNQTLAEQQGIKLTPIVFLMKAVVAALKEYPHFNASLDNNGPQGAQLVVKKYFHIAVAVDTPNGLVVPVIRDVDRKGLFQLAKELGEISTRARAGQLKAEEMQGSCFTISSLGGIGGTAFTPIVNVPDVAILGVSKAAIKPVYLEGEFKPRLILPLSLSYDHRVIDGAEGARFSTFLVKQLSDIRRLLF
jgi:pyruvate dehydrogenase E2 component (dihydrolipoamide acetyltransferase)